MRDALFGAEVARALAAVEHEDDPLVVGRRLRAVLPLELARRAAELHALRRRALRRFPRWTPRFLTRKGLEQASSEAVAEARAARVAARAPGAAVADLTCGIGADTLALARGGRTVVACDRDALLVACARANLEAAGLPARVVQAAAERPAVRAELRMLDPDRRAGGARSADPWQASPDLGTALQLASGAAGACLKLAPAASPEAVLAAVPGGLACELQWVGQAGELAELALWTGVLAPGGGPRRVTRLDAPGGPAEFVGRPLERPALEPEQAAAVPWLAAPHPALVRSGLLGALAAELELRPVAPRIAFLGGARRPDSPLLVPWRVLGSAPLDRRRVRRLLGEHDVGPVQVHKRGHPDPAEVLARRLRGPGSRPGHLFVARLERGHRAWLVERVEPPGPLVGDEGFEPPTSSL